MSAKRKEEDLQRYYRMTEEAFWEDGLMAIRLREFIVIRRTPRGVWVRPANGYGTKERFILDGDGKRYAYPTIEQAKASFIIRKEWQITHLGRQLVFAKAALKGVKAPDFVPDKAFHDDTLDEFHSY